jgi:hypothetical protein
MIRQVIGLYQPARADLIAVRRHAASGDSFVEALILHRGAGLVDTVASMGEPEVHVFLQTQTPAR